MRLGILGGTFNPIHLGHLMLADAAREQCDLDQVWLMPTNAPPHKSSRGLPDARVRLELVRQAVRGHPGLRASDLELRLGGVSYTVRTVRWLRARYPTAKLFLIVGSDMLRVPWMALDELRRLCTFVVADRQLQAAAPQRHSRPGAALLGGRRVTGVRRIATPRVDLSSTMIRNRVRRGLSIRYVVPETVRRTILRRGLYRRSRA